MARRRSWVDSWQELPDVWANMRDVLTRATKAFRRKSPVGIAPDEDDYLKQRDAFEEQAHAITSMQLAVEAMTIELAQRMYRSGWTLREIARLLNTNHSGVSKWMEQTGTTSPRDDLR